MPTRANTLGRIMLWRNRIRSLTLLRDLSIDRCGRVRRVPGLASDTRSLVIAEMLNWTLLVCFAPAPTCCASFSGVAVHLHVRARFLPHGRGVALVAVFFRNRTIDARGEGSERRIEESGVDLPQFFQQLRFGTPARRSRRVSRVRQTACFRHEEVDDVSVDLPMGR